MEKAEYQALKKALGAQLGANDAETLKWYALKMQKNNNLLKYACVAGMILSIPLFLVFLGFVTLPLSIFGYFMVTRDGKKYQAFSAHIDNDPEFSVS